MLDEKCTSVDLSSAKKIRKSRRNHNGDQNSIYMSKDDFNSLEESTKIDWLRALNLVPTAEAVEMKTRRSRRSTANPLFSMPRPKSSTFYYALNSRVKNLEEEKSQLCKNIAREGTRLENLKRKSSELRKKANDLEDINEMQRIKISEFEQLQTLRKILPTL
ncbi:unnamed protein product [Dimorphilus gyrociliatus]|uniref:Uncharacterized protein n=1 Tax=Dimorphilus gyrociliatus TaxID=2664684 RepID=A0A7I8V4I8_9ANNE|nr:unnamed protein product [Dimorphilus gyrociliatus]